MVREEVLVVEVAMAAASELVLVLEAALVEAADVDGADEHDVMFHDVDGLHRMHACLIACNLEDPSLFISPCSRHEIIYCSFLVMNPT